MRSKWKFKYVDPSLYYQYHKYNELFYVDKEEKKKNSNKNFGLFSFDIWSRKSTVLPEFLNSVVNIYNGSKFINVKIESSLINHKFGEFAYSKKLGPTIHVLGKKKKLKKK